ncbi:MAG: hypothetical protein KatS3mg001_509 [Candidatus Pacearchaeota archaeon]|nr:MAG: hypothetical protein KatS3mg001_509 [Candidatus Pacearchaeota archaeon]
MGIIPSNPQRINRWNLIPPSWKADVDKSLLNVLSLNRKFIKNLENDVRKISFLSPEDFLSNLISSWYNHNTFFSSLIPFLISLPEDGHITQLQAISIQKILNDMGLVDRITLLHSLAIKPLLERNHEIGFIPFNSFYIDYLLDHHDLVCCDASLEDIIQKYHGNSVELFEQRKNRGILSKIFSGISDDRERKELRKLKEKMFLSALYDYFIDRPNKVKALVKISTIDNFDEYRFLYNLDGIEGFYLKDYLIRNGLLEDTRSEIENLLNYFALLNVRMERTPQEQGLNYKKLPFYVQSSRVSCASTCAMMVSNFFYSEDVSKEREDQFHSAVKSAYLEGCPFSKIALTLSRMYPQLKISLHHTDPNLFDIEKVRNLFGDLGILAVKEYKQTAEEAEKNGVTIDIQEDIEEVIQKTLDYGGVYMAATNLGGGVLHSELIVGKNKTKFAVYNPLNGNIELIDCREFKKKMQTPIGVWGISFIALPGESKEYKSSIEWFRKKDEELKDMGIILSK